MARWVRRAAIPISTGAVSRQMRWSSKRTESPSIRSHSQRQQFTSIEVGGGRTGTVSGPIWGDDNNGAAVGGNDSIQKSGAGTLILTGGTDQVDEIFVAEGTLLAQSTINTARVTVSAGATLGGTGTIGGDTIVNGTLSTGSSAATGSVGDLAFSGAATDLTFSAGSLWLIDIVQGATDNADTVVVGGLLALGDAVIDPTFFFTGTYTVGTKYTLATYGSRSGSFLSFADNTIYSLGGSGGGTICSDMTTPERSRSLPFLNRVRFSC